MCSTEQALWPQHVARRITDQIHSDVKVMVSNSRLVRKCESIMLVLKSEIDVDCLLGQGAFSEVHRVRHCNKYGDCKTYAMKHLKPKLISQPENFRLAAAELAVEAHMLASFDHPNIIKIHGWAANGVASFAEGRNDSFFLLLDCLDETLDQRITTWTQQQAVWRAQEELYEQQSHQIQSSFVAGMWRRLSLGHFHEPELGAGPLLEQRKQQEEHRALRHQHQEQVLLEKLGISTEIASALNYLHEKGVIFRDLKPNNIGFLGGRVKLFDFGLSREIPGGNLHEPFQMSGKVGTLRYMAVEVACHQPYNVSADVYSWAMVCYEMLTLLKPFCGWTREMHSNLVCSRGMRPSLVADDNSFVLSEHLRHLLENSWCQQPMRRPSMRIVTRRMQQLEQEQLMVVHHLLKLQQQVPPEDVVVELPQDFMMARKAPLRHASDYTGGTMSLSAASYDG